MNIKGLEETRHSIWVNSPTTNYHRKHKSLHKLIEAQKMMLSKWVKK